MSKDPEPAVDVVAVEAAVRQLLQAMHVPAASEVMRETPRRVAESYRELLTPTDFTVTTFANDEGYEELIVVRDIPVQSLCEHHLLPFVGVAHIGYLPDARLVGLSKFARVVDAYSRRLQLQERLTCQVADWFEQQLAPKGVGVVIEAEHFCMTLRGARAHGAATTTSAMRGDLREDARTRAEFLSMIAQPRRTH